MDQEIPVAESTAKEKYCQGSQGHGSYLIGESGNSTYSARNSFKKAPGAGNQMDQRIWATAPTVNEK